MSKPFQSHGKGTGRGSVGMASQGRRQEVVPAAVPVVTETKSSVLKPDEDAEPMHYTTPRHTSQRRDCVIVTFASVYVWYSRLKDDKCDKFT